MFEGYMEIFWNFAKAFAFAQNVPLVAVDHMKAHIAAAYVHKDGQDAPKPPFIALAVSGGHTSIYKVGDYTDFAEIGGTRDDAAGEAFDKIGRVIGLPYPGGAAMDKLAYEGDPDSVALPSPALTGETLDFSFSGIKTAALNYINSEKQKGNALANLPLAAGIAIMVLLMALALPVGNFRALQKATPKDFIRWGDVQSIVEDRIGAAENILSVAARVALDADAMNAAENAVKDMEKAKTAREISRADQQMSAAMAELTGAKLEGEDGRSMMKAADTFAEYGSFLRQEARDYNKKAETDKAEALAEAWDAIKAALD